jgi:transposase-like protein
MCTNKPLVLVDKGPWYKWALERLGLEYRYERFFRYLKERTMVFNHKMSARDRIQGIRNLKLSLNPIHNILIPPRGEGGE